MFEKSMKDDHREKNCFKNLEFKMQLRKQIM